MMADVFLIGALISFIKLAGYAIDFGFGVIAFAGFVTLLMMVVDRMKRHPLWPADERAVNYRAIVGESARQHQVVGCRSVMRRTQRIRRHAGVVTNPLDCSISAHFADVRVVACGSINAYSCSGVAHYGDRGAGFDTTSNHRRRRIIVVAKRRYTDCDYCICREPGHSNR